MEASGRLWEPVVAVWLLLRPWWYLKGVGIRSGEAFGAGSGLKQGRRAGSRRLQWSVGLCLGPEGRTDALEAPGEPGKAGNRCR